MAVVASRFYVWVKHSGTSGNWLDISGVVMPDWDGSSIVSEEGVGNFSAGSITFNVVDRDVTTARAVLNALATSTTVPEVRVTWGTTGETGFETFFYGRVEPDLFTYEGAVISSFTACSLLQYLDKLDAHNVDEGTTLLTSADGDRVGGPPSKNWAIDPAATDLYNCCVTAGDVATIGGVDYTIAKVTGPKWFTVTADIVAASGGCVIKRGTLGQFSGPVARTVSGRPVGLAPILLRKAMIQDSSIIDCLVLDKDLRADPDNPVQSDTDWNHVKRCWSDSTVDLAGDTAGDVVAASQDCMDNDVLAFTLKHGRLYAIHAGADGVHEEGELTEVLDGSGDPYTTTGHRLFNFLAEDDTRCLAVFEAEKRHTYTRQTGQAAWGPWATGAVGIAGTALAIAAGPLGWGAWAAAAISLGAAGAAAGLGALSTTHADMANSDQFYACTGVRVLDMGDGTNGTGGVGRDINRYQAAPYSTNLRYVPGDSVCTDAFVKTVSDCPGVILFAPFDEVNQKITVMYYYWNTNTSQWDGPIINAGSASAGDTGKPTGGMVSVERNVVVGTANGCFQLTCQANGGWAGRSIVMDRPPSRFLAALRRIDDTDRYLEVLWGNDSQYVLEQQYLDGGTWFATPPAHDLYTITSSLSGMRLLVSNPYVIELSGADHTPVIYEAIDADGRRLLYAGFVRTTGATPGAQLYGHTSAEAVCQYPLANIGGDWRPPVLYLDDTQDVYRFLTLCCWLDRDYLITDVHHSSCYARAYVHADFKRDRVSIAQALRGLAQSFYCYLRILDRDPCASTDEPRLISRHGWTLPDAGDLTTDDVEASSARVDGILAYDGAVADLGGQRIEVGATGVGKTVYAVQGMFLTPTAARWIGAAVVAEYPRRSSDFPYGRRRFLAAMRDLSIPERTDGVSVKPHPRIFGQSKQVTFFEGVDVPAQVQSFGSTGSDELTYPVSLIETKAGLGVTWAADEPTNTPTAVDLPTYETQEPPASIAPTERTVDWVISSAQLETPVAKGSASAYVWGLLIDLGTGGYYKGVKVKQLSLGVAGDEKFKMSLFTDAGNAPGVEIADTEVDYDPAGKAAGLQDADSAANPWVSGMAWLMICRENATTADIAYRDAAVVAAGYAFYGAVGSFDYPVIPASMTDTDTVPDILVRLEV